MPQVIVIRLHPDEPVDGGTFSASLAGLVITALDLSIDAPTATGTTAPRVLGSASYTLDDTTRIAQHLEIFSLPPGPELAAAATAVIVLPSPPPTPPWPEHVDPDVLLRVQRGGITVANYRVDYNTARVELTDAQIADPSSYQSIGSTSLFIALPPAGREFDPTDAHVELPTDGSPPAFADLLNAVRLVLDAEDSATTTAAEQLSLAQIRHVASELAYERTLFPFEGPDVTELDYWYTEPAASDDGRTNARRQFEASLLAYNTTHDGRAELLNGYITALVSALRGEQRSMSTEEVGLLVPTRLDPSVSPTGTVRDVQVMLVGGPDFVVPAAFFYALTAELPASVGFETRYRSVTAKTEGQILAQLQSAIDRQVIGASEAPATTPFGTPISLYQAARRIRSLGLSAAPRYQVEAQVSDLVQSWLAFPTTLPPSQDIREFWRTQVDTPAELQAHLRLIMAVIAEQEDPSALITALAEPAPPSGEGLDVETVEALVLITPAQWTSFFAARPWLLPANTLPGNVEERTRAFVRRLQRFFDVSLGGTPLIEARALQVPRFDPAPTDPVGTLLDALGGLPLTLDAAFEQALHDVFPNDEAARAWLREAALALNELFLLTQAITLPATPSPEHVRFSLMEALYARGYTRRDQIANTTLADFRLSLVGTVAYPLADALYLAAGGEDDAEEPLPGEFRPVNPDGELVNCVPAAHRSGLGPVAYLHELLRITDGDTCEGEAGGEGEETNLAEMLSDRRGPLGELQASASNLNVCVPSVDLVNECLEGLAAEVATGGTDRRGWVYDTHPSELHGHRLGAPPAAHATDHDPITLFGVLPEHASPATPVARPEAYEALRQDFSAPGLPYAQSVTIVRGYLQRLCTSRFEVMRTFRREITEFVLAPSQPPDGFVTHQWRYPVRFEIACEYLGIHPEEAALFIDAEDAPETAALYGSHGGEGFPDDVLSVPVFLERLGLRYGELAELVELGITGLTLEGPGSPPTQAFPACEPCCLADYRLQFESEGDQTETLRQLAIFVRLSRKQQQIPCARYTLREFSEICRVLQLRLPSGELNPDFVRQFAAFQLLRDDFAMPARDRREGSSEVDGLHLHLLALWVGPQHPKWAWAVDQLIQRIADCAQKKHHCPCRAPEFLKLLHENLDPLSVLAGFDPSVAARSWHARPAHTLRFAEILEKIYASHFTIGELLFVLRAEPHLAGDDPFPLQPANEAREDPLAVPDDDADHGLWDLRAQLLAVEVDEDAVAAFSWDRIVRSLQEEFGLVTDAVGEPLRALGRHFFPELLASQVGPADPKAYTYRVPLENTSPAMWSTPDGPFDYDAASRELYTSIPLTDEAVLHKLQRIRQLRTARSPDPAAEQEAVRTLYFAPRRELARFAYLFPSFAEAERQLIEEPDEAARFRFFQRSFALFRRRANAIAEQLAQHVANVTGYARKDATPLAKLILKHLYADENFALTPWEDDAGAPPDVTWPAQPQGGAYAALLGVVGTGLLGEYRAYGAEASDAVLYRELRGPSRAFNQARDRWNAPVPTVLPSMSFTLRDAQQEFVSVRNGFALRNEDGAPLGGAEGFAVVWRGVLMVEQAGDYRFFAGAPRPDTERPSDACPAHQRWRVSLQRGQRSWILLSHGWKEDHAPDACSAALPLRRGAYDLTIELVVCPPAYERAESALARESGFELAYQGPDTGAQIVAIPHDKLFVADKRAPLGEDVATEDGLFVEPTDFLNELYYSTLRDARRTYQRAFRALLFSVRHGLHAAPIADDGQSELGYLLSKPESFAGVAFYPTGGAFAPHRAWLDFNLLPVDDNYHPPTDDARQTPSTERTQALFDGWERIFDYTQLRSRARTAPERPAWLLFHEASEHHPDDPAHLLRHLGVDLSHAPLVLRYYRDYVLSASGSDLENERWPVRIQHADLLLERIRRKFAVEDIRDAAPDTWAADEPGDEGGAENLTRFVRRGYLENGEPRRYRELGSLNDPLRESARAALIAYLCRLDRVPLPWGGFATTARDLSDLLLLDVEAGLCQRQSRIEEAVSAVQAFVQRQRLGLEPDWLAAPAFSLLWERRFQSLAVWQACKRRTYYRENWIEFDELATARRSEAFRLLEDQLRATKLSVAAPASLTNWNAPTLPATPGHALVQAKEPAISRFVHPPQIEALGLMGARDRHARPTWLTDVNGPGMPSGGSPPNDVATALQFEHGAHLPLWIEAAIRLGTRFLRVAAAGDPPASNTYRVHRPVPGCCVECGTIHPPTLDEYYFWLLDSEHFEPVTQDAHIDGSGPTPDGVDPESAWRQPEDLPTLLDWSGRPLLHLCWARIHNGELKQPRRSSHGIRLADDVTTRDLTLELVGRFADSLKFQVVREGVPLLPGAPEVPGAEANTTGLHGSDAPGFRYDLVTDTAEVLPLLEDPEEVPAEFFNSLAAYPYFVHFTPGASLFPTLFFSQAIAVASSLRSQCRFDAALGWYDAAFAPLHDNAAWCGGLEDDASGSMVGSCCSSGEISLPLARRRALTLNWLETALGWSDALMRVDTPEAFQRARVVLDAAARLLGPTPKTVDGPPSEDVTSVSDFIADGVPLNPRLLALYERVGDRRSLIQHCLNARRLRHGPPPRDLPYFGAPAPHDGWHSSMDPCDDEETCCAHQGLYRLASRLPKALELAGEARTLGTALLLAYEKGDAEYLASLRAAHERQILTLALEVRKDQWRDADWQVQALNFTKQIAQTRRRYTQGLLDAGLNAGERDFQDLTEASNAARTAGNVSEIIAEIMHFIPDVHVGTLSFTTLPVGSKVAYVFQAVARIARATADVLGAQAGLRLTEGGWARREDEWRHQLEVFDLELEQIERQILSAARRRSLAFRELNNHRRQIEHSAEVQDFLRDKFTSQELYLWLQKETAALYYQMYELALHEARRAQAAYNFELGHLHERFLPSAPWDDLHEGLLAGERLSLALRQMESAYLCKNQREYELVKHISLRCFAPLSLLQLKTAGQTEIELPEWLFDLDYPGHYLRRIKSVSISLPCVTGPYHGIQCKLTLLSSSTRVDPRLRGPHGECEEATPPIAAPDPCACPPFSLAREAAVAPADHGYLALPGDPRVVFRYGASSAIATSSGQNDAGMFDLNFADPRYLPFEYEGAVSRFRIELPAENNYFDLDTLSDCVLHLRYTAREGGEALAAAARAAARDKLPDGGVRLFDVKREWPDAWARLTRGPKSCEPPKRHDRRPEARELALRWGRDDFIFLPGQRRLTVVRLEVLFELPPRQRPHQPCLPDCAEALTPARALHTLRLTWDAEHTPCCAHCGGDGCGCADCHGRTHFLDCVESDVWPGLFQGVLDILLPVPEQECMVATLTFPADLPTLEQVFVVCGYRADRIPVQRC